MELLLELKICEGCGSLWYRIQNQRTVYCKHCELRLRDFPAPTAQRRRRSSRRNPSLDFEPEACLAGGER